VQVSIHREVNPNTKIIIVFGWNKARINDKDDKDDKDDKRKHPCQQLPISTFGAQNLRLI
jgi:hypothetical protein